MGSIKSNHKEQLIAVVTAMDAVYSHHDCHWNEEIEK